MSTSVDDRRDIVRNLIEERDRSRQQTAVVRARSGLGVDRFPSLSDDVRADDVIPDAAGGDDDGFRLTPGEGDDADSVYRGESQFEDGSLGDFIRKLKRETRPPAPVEEPAGTVEGAAETPASDEADQQDIEARFLGSEPRPVMLLAALAPVVGPGPADASDAMIRLAAAGDEPGFFCSYLGWTVAWSSMCVDEAEAQTAPDGDGGLGADLEEELGRAEDDTVTEGRRSERSRSSPPDETDQERVERRLSEEDAAEAIENAGRSALAPVASSLEKLREFIEARRASGAVPSQEERTPALRRAEPASPAAATIDRPPLPRSRPERRENITIVDRGERFDFIRTPRPHFRPSREEPVILPPADRSRSANNGAGQSGFARPPLPQLKPPLEDDQPVVQPSDDRRQGEPTASAPPSASDPATGQKDEGDAATRAELLAAREQLSAAIAVLAEGVADVEAADPLEETPSALPDAAEAAEPTSKALANLPAPTAEPSVTPPPTQTPELAPPPAAFEMEPLIITFEPQTPGLPDGADSRLAALLKHARTTDQTIHIIGEASTNHLARRRATDVGAALVQLGATVEILEYDHQARTGVDQVRLVLKSEAFDPLFSTTEPAATPN